MSTWPRSSRSRLDAFILVYLVSYLRADRSCVSLLRRLIVYEDREETTIESTFRIDHYPTLEIRAKRSRPHFSSLIVRSLEFTRQFSIPRRQISRGRKDLAICQAMRASVGTSIRKGFFDVLIDVYRSGIDACCIWIWVKVRKFMRQLPLRYGRLCRYGSYVLFNCARIQRALMTTLSNFNWY